MHSSDYISWAKNKDIYKLCALFLCPKSPKVSDDIHRHCSVCHHCVQIFSNVFLTSVSNSAPATVFNVAEMWNAK